LFAYFAKKWTREFAFQYDEKNITPSDYTIFTKIEPEQNEAFNNYIFNEK
jgi:hypothetical protein